jgi:SAM-dependent methyltransferase
VPAAPLKLRFFALIRRSDRLRALAARRGLARAGAMTAPWIAALGPGSSVIDAGCGAGWVGAHLARLGHPVTGVDPLDKRLADLPFRLGRAERLPFPDGAADWVLFCCMLHHVEAASHEAILREARRVARRGVVVVEDVYEGTAGRRLTALVDRLLNLDPGRHPHANRRTGEWVALLRECGFEPVLVREWRRWHHGLFPMRHAAIVAAAG